METILQTHTSKFGVVAWTLVASLPGVAAVGGWLSLIFGVSFDAWFVWEATAILALLTAFVCRRRLKRYATEGQEALYVVSTLLSLPAFLTMLVVSLLVVYATVLSL